MPDLGLEIEDFQAQTWKIENWSQQPKRLVGPEFSCGGHKWCVTPFLASFSANADAGEYYYSLKGTRMVNQMIWSPFTSIMRTQKPRPKGGTHVHNSAWPSQILSILPYKPPVVSTV